MIPPASLAGPRVYFGGPDQPPRLLRDLLEERVEAVPAGGAIDWMTYYFRDERLAQALVRARHRGVAVNVTMEAEPRQEQANDRVLAILADEGGIGAGLRAVRAPVTGHLHTKLYGFSHPTPHALVGSFNPSGNEPEDARIVAEIGDQDRGHNLLVEFGEARMAEALVRHARRNHALRSRVGARFLPGRGIARSGPYEACFFPRLPPNPLDARLRALGPGTRLRIAASHFKDVRVGRALARLARLGARVEVLTHHTLRRSPNALIERLRGEGVRVYRYDHPQQLPMHAKFILAEGRSGRQWSALGSYNLNPQSRWFNQELLMFSDDADLWRTLDRRWEEIASEPWCKS
jgi:hypothetical protein